MGLKQTHQLLRRQGNVAVFPGRQGDVSWVWGLWHCPQPPSPGMVPVPVPCPSVSRWLRAACVPRGHRTSLTTVFLLKPLGLEQSWSLLLVPTSSQSDFGSRQGWAGEHRKPSTPAVSPSLTLFIHGLMDSSMRCECSDSAELQNQIQGRSASPEWVWSQSPLPTSTSCHSLTPSGNGRQEPAGMLPQPQDSVVIPVTALDVRLSPRGEPCTAGARRQAGDGADMGRPITRSRGMNVSERKQITLRLKRRAERAGSRGEDLFLTLQSIK